MFKKYTSIKNTYSSKEMYYFLNKFPELENETYSITEKIHGANISFIFGKNGEFKIAKRTSFIEEGDKFYGIQQTIKKYQELIDVFKEYSINNNIDITIFGEYFGGGIQKGINYGEEKKMLFFDITIDNLYISQKEYSELMFAMGFSDLSVPEVAVVGSLKEALDYDIDFDSSILGIENNKVEGIVIKPLNKVYVSGNGSIFYLKKKSKAFMEINRKRKERVEPSNLDLFELNREFVSYITENRLESIFSKYGEIDTIKEIGKYIIYLMEDAKKDFIEDNSLELEKYSKSEVKYVFNVGGKIANMIKKYL